MSSGILPFKTYHRAQRLGEGAFGSVCTVYDDEGSVYALKVFDADEDDGTLDLCTLREVTMMRLLRGKTNGHTGVLDILDVTVIDDDKIGIVMPKFGCNLEAAIEGGLFKSRPQKVVFAHKLLTALAFLHDNGIMHRDIKCDNIMLRDDQSPVLIDFSIAKFLSHHHDEEQEEVAAPATKTKGAGGNRHHTSDMGTATYMAPEVYRKMPYGCKADVWSAGIVLVELFRGKMLDAEKDKAAFRMIESIKAKMPDKPMPNLLKKMLSEDPSERLSAREALRADVFSKRKLVEPAVRHIDAIPRALRGDVSTARKDEAAPATKGKGKKRKQGKEEKLRNLRKSVKSLYNDLEFQNPLTLSAAICFAERVGLLENEESAEEGDIVGLEHCLVLAMKLFELEKYDLEDTEDLDDALPEDLPAFDIDVYAVAELAIFKAMDYCLYDFPHVEVTKDDEKAGRRGKKKKKKGKKKK